MNGYALAVVLKDDPVIETKKPEDPASNDESYIKVKALPLNQWICFNNDSTIRWGQLTWQSTETEQYLFTDKKGNKLFEMDRPELIKLFSNDQAHCVPVYQKTITEQILSHL